MGDYTTTAAVKRQLGIGVNGTVNTVDDDLIAVYVTDASQAISTYCKRNFFVTYGTLYWDARYPAISGRKLYFDQDVLGVDSLSNGSNGTINAANYRLLPQHYSPKYALELLTKSNMVWLDGNDGFAQNAIVTIGSFGYCEAANQPADVTLAATKLAAWLYQTRENSETDTIQMADGSVSIPSNAPPMVFKLLEKYVRRVSYS